MKVAFVGKPVDAWYQRKVLRALGRSNITLTVSSVATGLCGVGRDVNGFLGQVSTFPYVHSVWISGQVGLLL